jgi:hypothetical protein
MLSFIGRNLEWAAAAYAFFAIATFGHLYRHSTLRRSLPRQLEMLTLATLWPVYWLVAHGVANTLRVAFEAVDVVLGRGFEMLGVIWFLTALCFPAYYIAVFWSAARNWGERVAIIAKAVAWAPFWPAYLFT